MAWSAFKYWTIFADIRRNYDTLHFATHIPFIKKHCCLHLLNWKHMGAQKFMNITSRVKVWWCPQGFKYLWALLFNTINHYPLIAARYIQYCFADVTGNFTTAQAEKLSLYLKQLAAMKGQVEKMWSKAFAVQSKVKSCKAKICTLFWENLRLLVWHELKFVDYE